jgi:hypothetical protein
MTVRSHLGSRQKLPVCSEKVDTPSRIRTGDLLRERQAS